MSVKTTFVCSCAVHLRPALVMVSYADCVVETITPTPERFESA